jgi:hypothetical protein
MTQEGEKQIREELERCHAVHPAGLSGLLGVPATAIQAWLDERVQAGEIELLRPIGCVHREIDYYRLIRETDGDYL